eukprot:3417632-Lingulodinium_polyedra.AAC.1
MRRPRIASSRRLSFLSFLSLRRVVLFARGVDAPRGSPRVLRAKGPIRASGVLCYVHPMGPWSGAVETYPIGEGLA